MPPLLSLCLSLCSEFAFMAAVFFFQGFYVTSRNLSLVASRVGHSTQSVFRSHLAELNFF